MLAESSFISKTLNRFRRRWARPNRSGYPDGRMEEDYRHYPTYDPANRRNLPPPPPHQRPPPLRRDIRGPLPPPPVDPPPMFTPEEPRVHNVHKNGDLIPANGHAELLRHPSHDHKRGHEQRNRHYRKSEPPPANSDYNGNHANTKSLVNRKKKKIKKEEHRMANGDPTYLDPVPRQARHKKGPAPPPPMANPPSPRDAKPRKNEHFDSHMFDEVATEPPPRHDSYWDFILEGRKIVDAEKLEKTKKGKKHKRKGSPPRNDPYRNARPAFAGAAPDPYQINDYRHRMDEADMDLDIGLFEPGVNAPEAPPTNGWTTRL